jgi:hypothetical protein
MLMLSAFGPRSSRKSKPHGYFSRTIANVFGKVAVNREQPPQHMNSSQHCRVKRCSFRLRLSSQNLSKAKKSGAQVLCPHREVLAAPPSNSARNRITLLPGWAGTAIRPPGQNLCPVAHASRFSDGPSIFLFWLQMRASPPRIILSIFARRGSGRRKPWQSMIHLQVPSSTDGLIATPGLRPRIRTLPFTDAQGVGNPGEAWLIIPCASRAGPLSCTRESDAGTEAGARDGRYTATIRAERPPRSDPRVCIR